MRTKFLQELGLEEAVIKKIFMEHGKSLHLEKAKNKALTSQLEVMSTENDFIKKQLIKTSETISETRDIEFIKAQVADYKEKYESAQAELVAKLVEQKEKYEAKIVQLQLENILTEKLSSYQFSSAYAKKGVFNEISSKQLKLEDGKIVGFDDALDTIKLMHPTAFITEASL